MADTDDTNTGAVVLPQVADTPPKEDTDEAPKQEAQAGLR